MTLEAGDVAKLQRLTKRLTEVVGRLVTASEYDEETRDWLSIGPADTRFHDGEPFNASALRSLEAEVRELRRLWSDAEDRGVWTDSKIKGLCEEADRVGGVLKGHWNVISSFQEHDQAQDAKLDELADQLGKLRAVVNGALTHSQSTARGGRAVYGTGSRAELGFIEAVLDQHKLTPGVGGKTAYCACGALYPCKYLIDIGRSLDRNNPGWRDFKGIAWVLKLLDVVEGRW